MNYRFAAGTQKLCQILRLKGRIYRQVQRQGGK